MSGVKIQLSLKEREMAGDPGIILTKNRIIGAVVEMLGEISAAETAWMQENRQRLPPQAFLHPPKISRGEQYRHLPWVMLDHPRCFEQGNMLAVRHLFWWGNQFSVAVLASGNFKERLVNRKDEWPHDGYVCVHASPWEHHFDADNYIMAAQMETGRLIALLEKKEFIKLALCLPVAEWHNAPAFFLNGFRKWMDLLQI